MSSSAGGTLYLIFIQVASRGLTFIGNQILLRYLSPTLLGIAVQLELVSVTILYFARESLRVALQRQPAAGSDSKDRGNEKRAAQRRSQAVVNLSYLVVVLGLLIALVSGLWYLRIADIEVLESPQFRQAYYVYGVATLVELCAEPFFVVIQQHSLYEERARAETSGAISRCVFACATAFVIHRQGLSPSVLPFAVGQLAYSVLLFGLYFYAAQAGSRTQHFNLLPQRITSSTTDYVLLLFNKPILTLATTMYVQSIFKLALTEGDHLILSFLSSLADQGAFALASNYGGLLARLVFQPIEESSRNIFGRLLSAPAANASDAAESNDKDQTKAKSNPPTTTSPSKENVTAALSHLSTTLHTYTLLSLPLLALIPPLVPHLAPLILSSHWRPSSITALLGTYIYLIPFLAVNGILDAFVTSVASPAQLRGQSVWMILFTGVYGAGCWLFLGWWGWGTEGLVWANVVGMVGRVASGAWFVDWWIWKNVSDGEEKGGNGSGGGNRDERRRFWRDSIPKLSVVGVAVLVGVLVKVSQGMRFGAVGKGEKIVLFSHFEIDVEELGKIMAGAVVLGSVILTWEGEFLISLVENVVPKRIASKIPVLRSRPIYQPPPQHNTSRQANKPKQDL